MHPVHLKHKTAVRELPSVASQSKDVPYFPNGGVAAPPFMVVSPVSHGADSFPGNGTPNDLIGQAAASWQILPQSAEQGHGVPGFKKWPRSFHSATFDLSSLHVMPFPDQAMPVPSGPGESLQVNNAFQRAEVAGWSAPYYGEQYEQGIADAGVGTGVANLQDPATVAYAIGWGFIG
jgi:hypothetical protein